MGTNYHNEALRISRILERKRQAQHHRSVDAPEDVSASVNLIKEIKAKAAQEELYAQSLASAAPLTDAVPTVARDRQMYDHSRNGPIRSDTMQYMSKEMKLLVGPKPGHMHHVWKG